MFLKGQRCYGPKCAVEKKAYPPGMHVETMRRRRGQEKEARSREATRRVYTARLPKGRLGGEALRVLAEQTRG